MEMVQIEIFPLAFCRISRTIRLMRKRLRIALGILLIVLLACVAWALLQPREAEPMYQGKRLSAWINDYRRSGPFFSESNSVVDQAIRAIGSNAIPTLLRKVIAKDSFAYRVRDLADQHGLHFLRPTTQGAEYERMQTVMAFHALGDEAGQAVPQLIELYRRNDYNYYAASALAAIGPAASNAIPVLLETVTNFPNRDVVAHAIVTIGAIHSKFEIVFPALVSALKSKDPDIQRASAYALTHYGTLAGSAVQDILPLITNSDPGMRVAATNALRAISPQTFEMR